MTLTDEQRLSLMGVHTLAKGFLARLDDIVEAGARLLPESSLDREEVKDIVSDFVWEKVVGETSIDGLLGSIRLAEERNAHKASGESGEPAEPDMLAQKYHAFRNVTSDLWEERKRQDAKWGEMNGNNSVVPDHSFHVQHLDYELLVADEARALCYVRHKTGLGSWLDILLEELSEALEASQRVQTTRLATLLELRKEMVQFTAVAVATIESLDRQIASETAFAETHPGTTSLWPESITESIVDSIGQNVEVTE